MIVQFCGLSGSGKSTLATNLKNILQEMGHKVEVLDGDEYRTHICAGLGFSRQDRNTNIKRLSFIANLLSKYGGNFHYMRY